VRGQGNVEITVRVRGRGKLVALTAVALVVVVVGAGGWLLWLPAWRPALHTGESYGIDVSAHQGEIDWPAVAADDIEFAYLKATEGADFTDRRFAANWDGVERAGLRRGAYHFYSLCSSGAAQARHFLSVVAPDPSVLPPAVDLELAGNCRSRPPPEELRHELGVFLTTLESAWGRQILLYLGADFEARYRIRDHVDRSLWQRNFLRRPAGDGWLIWQVSGLSRVDGVRGRVDLDVGRLCRQNPGPTCQPQSS
jgi:lysozyme